MGVPERQPRQDDVADKQPVQAVHSVLAGESRREGCRLRQAPERANEEARGDGHAGGATCDSDAENGTGREGPGTSPDVSPRNASRGAQHTPPSPIPTSAASFVSECSALVTVQDGTFVLCTTHPKKGYLPEFDGYTREQEEELREFALLETMDIMYHKNLQRLFSNNLLILVDPEYKRPPPTRKKTMQKKKKQVAAKVVAAASRPSSPPPREAVIELEEPAAASSPFPRARAATGLPSPPGQSTNLADFMSFWDDDES